MRYATVDFYSNPGSPYRTVYAPKVALNGSVTLEKAGVENVHGEKSAESNAAKQSS